jgi:hypothetical protein
MTLADQTGDLISCRIPIPATAKGPIKCFLKATGGEDYDSNRNMNYEVKVAPPQT